MIPGWQSDIIALGVVIPVILWHWREVSVLRRRLAEQRGSEPTNIANDSSPLEKKLPKEEGRMAKPIRHTQEMIGVHPYDWTERVRRVWRGSGLFCFITSNSSKSFGEQ